MDHATPASKSPKVASSNLESGSAARNPKTADKAIPEPPATGTPMPTFAPMADDWRAPPASESYVPAPPWTGLQRSPLTRGHTATLVALLVLGAAALGVAGRSIYDDLFVSSRDTYANATTKAEAARDARRDPARNTLPLFDQNALAANSARLAALSDAPVTAASRSASRPLSPPVSPPVSPPAASPPSKVARLGAPAAGAPAPDPGLFTLSATPPVDTTRDPQQRPQGNRSVTAAERAAAPTDRRTAYADRRAPTSDRSTRSTTRTPPRAEATSVSPPAPVTPPVTVANRDRDSGDKPDKILRGTRDALADTRASVPRLTGKPAPSPAREPAIASGQVLPADPPQQTPSPAAKLAAAPAAGTLGTPAPSSTDSATVAAARAPVSPAVSAQPSAPSRATSAIGAAPTGSRNTGPSPEALAAARAATNALTTMAVTPANSNTFGPRIDDPGAGSPTAIPRAPMRSIRPSTAGVSAIEATAALTAAAVAPQGPTPTLNASPAAAPPAGIGPAAPPPSRGVPTPAPTPAPTLAPTILPPQSGPLSPDTPAGRLKGGANANTHTLAGSGSGDSQARTPRAARGERRTTVRSARASGSEERVRGHRDTREVRARGPREPRNRSERLAAARSRSDPFATVKRLFSKAQFRPPPKRGKDDQTASVYRGQ
jgi:hypothetical protein